MLVCTELTDRGCTPLFSCSSGFLERLLIACARLNFFHFSMMKKFKIGRGNGGEKKRAHPGYVSTLGKHSLFYLLFTAFPLCTCTRIHTRSAAPTDLKIRAYVILEIRAAEMSVRSEISNAEKACFPRRAECRQRYNEPYGGMILPGT